MEAVSNIESDRPMIRIRYSIQYDAPRIKKDNLTMELAVPKGSTFYQVMEQAAKTDPNFSFKTAQCSVGHYITELNGTANDNLKQSYWGLYLSHREKKLIKGIDQLIPKNGEHVIMKYAKYG